MTATSKKENQDSSTVKTADPAEVEASDSPEATESAADPANIDDLLMAAADSLGDLDESPDDTSDSAENSDEGSEASSESSEADNSEESDEPVNDIDELLSSVEDALSPSDDLSEDENSEASDAGDAAPNDNIDDALKDLEQELGKLTDDVKGNGGNDENEQAAELTEETVESAATTGDVDGKDRETVSGTDDAEAQSDDPVPQDESLDTASDPTDESSEEAAVGIDDALAQLVDDLGATDDQEEKAISEVADESDGQLADIDETDAVEAGDQEIEDMLSQVTQEGEEVSQAIDDVTIDREEVQNSAADKEEVKTPSSANPDVSSPEAQPDLTQDAYDASGDHEPAESNAEAAEPGTNPGDKKPPIDDFDAALKSHKKTPGAKKNPKPQDQSEESPVTSEPAQPGPYDHFPLPQRMLVKSLRAGNKPFASVSSDKKDVLGLIGVLTCIISMITAAIALLLR